MLGTRQRAALGKSPLCRVQHSAKNGTRQKKWHLTAEPAHAVKFKKKIFAECRPWHSAKRAFAECQGPALGKDPFFAECHFLALSKGPLCRVPGPAHGKKKFWFFLPIFLWGFPTLFKTPCSNLGQFWFFWLYFVSFFCFVEFYGIFQIWTRCSKFHVSSWIRPQHTPNIMNIIFWITKFHYFMHLQFKFEVCKKIQRNEKN